MTDLVVEDVPVGAGALSVLRPPDAEALLTEEAFEREELLPYWAELWPSGVALAREVAARDVAGTSALELGCGLGLPALAAAAGGARVLAVDWSPDAIALLHRNAERNGLELEAAVASWFEPDALEDRGPFDLVLAADVLYERRERRAGARPALVRRGAGRRGPRGRPGATGRARVPRACARGLVGSDAPASDVAPHTPALAAQRAGLASGSSTGRGRGGHARCLAPDGTLAATADSDRSAR
jgi:SAM-dependent methyltransferase